MSCCTNSATIVQEICGCTLKPVRVQGDTLLSLQAAVHEGPTIRLLPADVDGWVTTLGPWQLLAQRAPLLQRTIASGDASDMPECCMLTVPWLAQRPPLQESRS